ncbi:MAG: GNAT family N-acetyltransferase [Flavobacteriales bacterium]|nr:GNAT family N-acetyltransferase [Flavobacteriales bacterium]
MLDLDLSTFPTLRTERLVLRQLTLGDAAAIHSLRQDPRTMEHIGRPLSTSLADAEDLIQRRRTTGRTAKGSVGASPCTKVGADRHRWLLPLEA